MPLSTVRRVCPCLLCDGATREIRSCGQKARTARCINVTLLARLHYRDVYIYERSVVLRIYPFISCREHSIIRVVDLLLRSGHVLWLIAEGSIIVS